MPRIYSVYVFDGILIWDNQLDEIPFLVFYNACLKGFHFGAIDWFNIGWFIGQAWMDENLTVSYDHLIWYTGCFGSSWLWLTVMDILTRIIFMNCAIFLCCHGNHDDQFKLGVINARKHLSWTGFVRLVYYICSQPKQT